MGQLLDFIYCDPHEVIEIIIKIYIRNSTIPVNVFMPF